MFGSGHSGHHPLFALILVLLTAGEVRPGTKVCGTLDASVEWTMEQSPYIVQNDILIPSGVRLSIHPGVHVYFSKPRACSASVPDEDWSDSAYSSIKVKGALLAMGTEKQPVWFQSLKKDSTAVGWDGIRIQNVAKGMVGFSHCRFLGANKAIQVEESEFTVKNCLFQANNTGIYLKSYSIVHVRNNNFAGNKSAGLYYENSGSLIENNIFAGNTGYGVWGDGSAETAIQYNGFWMNGGGNCYRCPSKVLKPRNLNAQGDSIDLFGNLLADPIFKDSPNHRKHAKRDLKKATDSSQVLDPEIAKMEARYQQRVKKGEPFRYLGRGSYLLSPYSALIDGGNPHLKLRDRDNSPNDIGMHGGPQEE